MLMSLIRHQPYRNIFKSKDQEKKNCRKSELFTFSFSIWFLLITSMLSSQASCSHSIHMSCCPHNKHCHHLHARQTCIHTSVLCPWAAVTTPASPLLGPLANGTVNQIHGHRSWSVWTSHLQVQLQRSIPKVFGIQLCTIFLKLQILRVQPRLTELVGELSRQPSSHLSTGLIFYSLQGLSFQEPGD